MPSKKKNTQPRQPQDHEPGQFWTAQGQRFGHLFALTALALSLSPCFQLYQPDLTELHPEEEVSFSMSGALVRSCRLWASPHGCKCNQFRFSSRILPKKRATTSGAPPWGKKGRSTPEWVDGGRPISHFLDRNSSSSTDEQ